MKTYSDLKLSKEYTKFYKIWLVSFVVLAIVNFIWYYVLLSRFYRTELFGILRLVSGKPMPVIEFMIVANMFFAGLTSAVVPRLSSQRVGSAVFRGCLLGLVLAGYHNFMNIFGLKDWNIYVVFADTVWGVLQGGILGYLASVLNKRFSH